MTNKEFLHLASRIISYAKDVQDSNTADYLYKDDVRDGAIIALQTLNFCYLNGSKDDPLNEKESKWMSELFKDNSKGLREGVAAINEMAAIRTERMISEAGRNTNLVKDYIIHYDELNENGSCSQATPISFTGTLKELKVLLTDMASCGCMNFEVAEDAVLKSHNKESQIRE